MSPYGNPIKRTALKNCADAEEDKMLILPPTEDVNHTSSDTFLKILILY